MAARIRGIISGRLGARSSPVVGRISRPQARVAGALLGFHIGLGYHARKVPSASMAAMASSMGLEYSPPFFVATPYSWGANCVGKR